jgi:RNA polymerase sigma-70 factor (ECF subfamily)
MQISTQDTVAGIRNGDMKCFERLFEEHYTYLCRVANGYLRDKQGAEEVVDDVFLRVWERREAIEIRVSVQAYLTTAVKYACLNVLARRKRDAMLLNSTQLEACREDFLVFDDGLSALIAKDAEAKLAEAIASLPEACRSIFCMSRFGNLSYQEIADSKQLSINTVKTQLKIALSKMRSALLIMALLLMFACR